MPVDLRPRNAGNRRPYCIHHGRSCEMGRRPLDDLTVLILQAKHNLGVDAPPIDEHRLATTKEQRAAEAELAEVIRQMKVKNAAEEAALRGEPLKETP